MSSMGQLSKYLSLVKFSHTIFAMPFALVGFFWGLYYSEQPLNWHLLLLVVLDMVWARNAAMAFNRYLDRNIDAKNERTAGREIPRGAISKHAALMFVVVNVILFFVTTYFINTLTFYLAPIAIFVILFYSYTKRFTSLCHLVLGVGLGLAPVGAFLSVTGAFHIVPVLLGFTVLFWVSGFDIIYALQDEDFDKKEKLNSIPVLLGAKKALWVSRGLHFLSVVLLIVIDAITNFYFTYTIGLVFFAIFLIYQQVLVKYDDLSKVNLAFFTMNGIASLVFSLLAIVGALVHFV